jgi:hypothetical protein
VIEEKDSNFFRKTASINVFLSGRERLWFRLASNSTEKIYGAGEQFTYLNLKGREFPMWIREQGKSISTVFLKSSLFHKIIFNLIWVQVLEETYPVLLQK